MAFLTYTYTFTNSTTADATQVNTNFTDVIEATSDGTLDFNINALTAAGAAVLNGHVTLGSASNDDLTVNASLASSIPIKTTRTYDLGSADLGMRIIYLAGNSTHTIALQAPSSGMSADYSLNLPPIAPTVGYGVQASSTSATIWTHAQTDVAAKTTTYVVLDTDGLKTITCNGSGTDFTVTLPALANNIGRTIQFIQTGVLDSDGTGTVTISRAGSDVIGPDSETSIKLYSKNDVLIVHGSATRWEIVKLNQIEYVFCTDVSDGNAAASFGYGPGGSQFCNNTSTNRLKRVRFLSAATAYTPVSLEVSENTGVTWVQVGTNANFVLPLLTQNATGYGMGLAPPTSSTDYDVRFRQYSLATGATFGAAGDSWANIDNDPVYLWRVTKRRTI